MKAGLMKQYIVDENVKFVYKDASDFYDYYKVYFGYVHNDLYFRKSNDYLLDKAKWLDGGYFIYENEVLIGGVVLFQNYMTDLFVIPPYDNYGKLVNLTLVILERISVKNKVVAIDEIADKYISYLENTNYDIKVNERWMFMISVTKKSINNLPAGYIAKEVDEFEERVLAKLLEQVYSGNQFSEEFYTAEEFLGNVQGQVKYKENNRAIYDSSRVIVDISSNEVVGMILMMEDEGLPFITDIVIDQNHQKKGLGGYLLRHAQNTLYGIYPCIRLSVNAGNSAVSLYRKNGFVGDGILTNYILNFVSLREE